MIFCDLPVKEFVLCLYIPVLLHDVLISGRGFHWCKPRYCFSWTEQQCHCMRGNSRAEKEVFLSFSIYPMHITTVCIIGKKPDHLTAFFQASKWLCEFAESGFSNVGLSSAGLFKTQPVVEKASGRVCVHSDIRVQEWHLRCQYESLRKISGRVASVSQRPFVKDSRTSSRGAFLLLSVGGISVLRGEVTITGTDRREIMN